MSQAVRTGQMQFSLGPGELCGTCGYWEDCGHTSGYDACEREWGSAGRGGVNALHPLNPLTECYLSSVGGTDISRIPVTSDKVLPLLPDFAHIIQPERRLREQLFDPFYFVGLSRSSINRSGLIECGRAKQIIGADSHQDLGLLLFGRDELLEYLWANLHRSVIQISNAGYSVVVAPSFSNYANRPRPEYLFNLKRSLVFFELLQERGVAVIPRLAWNTQHDIERCAEWAASNPGLTYVALDWSASDPASWEFEVDNLQRFDRMMEGKISYLVRGPSELSRYRCLYGILGLDRLHLCNAAAMACKPEAGQSFAERFEAKRKVIDIARESCRMIQRLPVPVRRDGDLHLAA